MSVMEIWTIVNKCVGTPTVLTCVLVLLAIDLTQMDKIAMVSTKSDRVHKQLKILVYI